MNEHRIFTSEGWKSLGDIVQPVVIERRQGSSALAWVLLSLILVGSVMLIVVGLR